MNVAALVFLALVDSINTPAIVEGRRCPGLESPCGLEGNRPRGDRKDAAAA
jgi:hypothetical protein